MNSLTTLLAWRYLRTRQESTITTMIIVCLLGMAIGSCALALVAFVMQGFEQTTYQKLQGIHSQIIMRTDQSLNEPAINSVVQQEFPEVEALSPSTQQYVIMKMDDDEAYKIVTIRGIHPEREERVSTLASTILNPRFTSTRAILPELLTENHVIIGSEFAEHYNLHLDDTLDLLIPSEPAGRKKSMHFESANAVVSGIFKTGIDDYDSNVIFCSLDFLRKLFPQTEITHVGMKLKPTISKEHEIIQKLTQRFGIDVYSWKELYPALLSALTLEKYVMFFILALITLVASMSIASLLFMLITQKRTDIAILKSMGVTDKEIARIFIIIGVTIAFIGSIIGLCGATIAGYLLENYKIITLPDVYFVTHLPAQINFSIIVLVFIVVMLMTVLATWLPIRRTRSINISHVLRYEG